MIMGKDVELSASFLGYDIMVMMKNDAENLTAYVIKSFSQSERWPVGERVT